MTGSSAQGNNDNTASGYPALLSSLIPRQDPDWLIKTTRYGNSIASTSSYLGFLASGAQGTLRAVYSPNNVPTRANSVYMPIARFCYNLGSASRSYTRDATTWPEMRQNPIAQCYAELSNGFSKASVVHGAITGISILLPESLISKLPGLPATALKYFRGPGFNMTALLGIVAAQCYNYSEKLETDRLIQHNASILSEEQSIPQKKAVEITKSSIPHLTNKEFCVKSMAFTASAVAAIGGLGGAIPILAARYSIIDRTIGNKAPQKIADIGGKMNGVFYASWPLFAALTHEGYNSEERRLPKHIDGMWKNLHKQAIMESVGILALTAGALGVFYKAKDGSKIKRIADIMLNKMDVIAGGGMGTYCLLSAAQEKAPDLLKQVQDLPEENTLAFKTQLLKLLDKNPLLESAFFARSVWLGPRQGISKEVGNYLEKTDTNKYSEREIGEYLRGIAKNLSKEALILNADTMPIKDLRLILEEGTFDKADPNNEMAARAIDITRLVYPPAHYAAEMRQKAKRDIKDNKREADAKLLVEVSKNTPPSQQSTPYTSVSTVQDSNNRITPPTTTCSR